MPNPNAPFQFGQGKSAAFSSKRSASEACAVAAVHQVLKMKQREATRGTRAFPWNAAVSAAGVLVSLSKSDFRS